MHELLIVFKTEKVKGVVCVVPRENLSEIIGQIRDGHPEAFNALYMETNSVVFFHAKSILKNEQDALDAVQDTYLAAFQKLDTLQEPKAAKQWLCGIASNVCFNKLRKIKHESGISLDDVEVFLEPEAPETTMPEKVLDRDSTSEIVKAMIENLSEVQKLTVIMFYFDEMSIAQIAQAMECSENTVKSRLNYARKNIEGQVLEEEKRSAKLYGVSPAIIALTLRFMAEQSSMPSGAVHVIASAIANGCSYSAALSAAGGMAASGTIAGGTAAVTGGTVATGIGAKLVASILAGAVVIGGTVTGVIIHNHNQQAQISIIEEPLEIAFKGEEEPVEAPSEDTGPNENQRIAAYVEFVRTFPVKRQEISRFMLYDCNADGYSELIALYTDTNSDFSPNLWAYGEVYTLNSADELEQMFSSGPMVLAGAGNPSFCEMTYEDKTYLAFGYSNGELGECGYDGYYELLTAGNGMLIPAHKLRYDNTIYFNRENGDEIGESTDYYVDDTQMTESAFREVEDNRKILAILWDEDQSMSQNEFLSYYG
ncbi:MAG: RNA polymerase sigma factor [Clostridia bacterium]|nr:RNA polymerase sigma factor [Clostridia bacterium]